MDNERPNEPTLWSSRLEEPGALPGTGLADKEAAWDRLYDRLRESEPPRRRRMIWLWAGAACLLLIVVPAALLLKEGHKSPRRPKPPIPVAISSGKEHTTPQDKQPSHQPVAINSTQPGRREEVGQAHREEIAPRPPVHPTHPTMVRPDLNKLPGHGADTLTLVLAPHPDPSRPPTVIAAAPPKKALRVVHINELEPSQPSPSMVKGPRQKAGRLHVGLVPQETFRPSTTYAEPEAHSILLLNHTQNP